MCSKILRDLRCYIDSIQYYLCQPKIWGDNIFKAEIFIALTMVELGLAMTVFEMRWFCQSNN